MTVVVRNDGSEAARDVEFSATAPEGWKTSFDPKQLPELAAGKSQPIKVSLTPSPRAIAGDYQTTIRANATGGQSESANFRITVLTSTLWGAVGIGDHRDLVAGRRLRGRPLRPALDRRDPRPGPEEPVGRRMAEEVVIRAQGLTKRYGATVAVDHIDLEVGAGEIVGILGPNGSGKTTTILMLLGLTEPTEGRAEVAGFDPLRDPLEVKRRVGYLPDWSAFTTGCRRATTLPIPGGWPDCRGARSTRGLPRRWRGSGCRDVGRDRVAPFRAACASGSALPRC